ncbi:MAG: sigma-54 dependent transcriptional regulator [Ahrensia sp.]|nr:sigma-54 dependent transcriptional regulator [Ahrensia sp.]
MSVQGNKSTVLVIDDDPVQRRILQATVERLGYVCITCQNGGEALGVLQGDQATSIAALVLDLMMPGIDGHGVLQFLTDQNLDIPAIVQTGQGGLDVAIKAMRAGAFDFVVKPVSPERLKASLSDALKVARVKNTQHKVTVETVFSTPKAPKMIASTDTMSRVGLLIDRAAKSDIPVLIEGESGTGKELVAQTICSKSERANKPLVIVNCGAIPENLVESILFGHEKGAFTGATEKHVGKFVEAHGGTLFLDEIGELPLGAQVKLLRALQQGEVEPVGASKSRKVDIRLISATNRDLIAAVREGRFREDLYYRLNVFPILVPPLRNRRGDIASLCAHFINNQHNSGQSFTANRLSDEAIKLLESYDWPGNIRQLENAIFRAMVLSDRAELGVDDFQQIAAQIAGPKRNAPDMIDFSEVTLSPEYPIGIEANDEIEHQDIDILPANSANQDILFARAFVDDTGHVRTLVEIEAAAIELAIAHYDGQMSEVARRLGIGRSTLYRKLKDYNLEPTIAS